MKYNHKKNLLTILYSQRK